MFDWVAVAMLVHMIPSARAGGGPAVALAPSGAVRLGALATLSWAGAFLPTASAQQDQCRRRVDDCWQLPSAECTASFDYTGGVYRTCVELDGGPCDGVDDPGGACPTFELCDESVPSECADGPPSARWTLGSFPELDPAWPGEGEPWYLDASSCDQVCADLSPTGAGATCLQSELDALDGFDANVLSAISLQAGLRNCNAGFNCVGPNACVEWGAPYVHNSDVLGGGECGTMQSGTPVAPCDQVPVDMNHRRLCPCAPLTTQLCVGNSDPALDIDCAAEGLMLFAEGAVGDSVALCCVPLGNEVEPSTIDQAGQEPPPVLVQGIPPAGPPLVFEHSSTFRWALGSFPQINPETNAHFPASSCDEVCADLSPTGEGAICLQSELDALGGADVQSERDKGVFWQAALHAGIRNCRVDYTCWSSPWHDNTNQCVQWGAPYIRDDQISENECSGGSLQAGNPIAPCDQVPVDMNHRRLCPCAPLTTQLCVGNSDPELDIDCAAEGLMLFAEGAVGDSVALCCMEAETASPPPPCPCFGNVFSDDCNWENVACDWQGMTPRSDNPIYDFSLNADYESTFERTDRFSQCCTGEQNQGGGEIMESEDNVENGLWDPDTTPRAGDLEAACAPGPDGNNGNPGPLGFSRGFNSCGAVFGMIGDGAVDWNGNPLQCGPAGIIDFNPELGRRVMCGDACGVCGNLPPDWQAADPNDPANNNWSLTVDERAPIRISIADDTGWNSVYDLEYADDQIWSPGGVARIWLVPSACYTVTTTRWGPLSGATWSLRDAFGVLVAQGIPTEGTTEQHVCHCDHNGGPPCLTCSGLGAPTGGTLGDCPDDGTLSSGAECDATCPNGLVQPRTCWNGTLSAPSSCCAPGSFWFPDDVGAGDCDACPVGKFDGDLNARTECTECSPGFFSGTAGSIECTACAEGQVAALPGMSECVSGWYANDGDVQLDNFPVDGFTLDADRIQIVPVVFGGQDTTGAGITDWSNGEVGEYGIGNCAVLMNPNCIPPQGYCAENVVVRYAWFREGYGVHAVCGNELQIENSAFTDNLPGQSALTLGSAPYPAVARVTHTKFINNTASRGAAIFVGYDSSATITACDFTSNHAAYLESDPRRWTFVSSELQLVPTEENRGGAIFLAGQAQANIDRSSFTGNVAKDGGAIYVFGGTGVYAGFGTLFVSNSRFLHNAIMSTSQQKGTHIYASSSPAMFYVGNTTFDPIDLDKAVALNRLAGCQEFACEPGNSCTYTEYSLFCSPCDAGTVSKGGRQCEVCPPGFGPDARQAGCEPCQGNTASSAGFECTPCLAGSAASADKQSCVDVGTGSVTDVALVADVLNSTNLLPKMGLVAEVEDVDAILGNAAAEDAYMQLLIQDISVSLGLDASYVKISGLRQAGGAQVAGRRVQETANQVAFDVEIAGDVDAGASFTELQQQLENPSSTLRRSSTAGSIDPSSGQFSFSCPIGLYRPVGAADCGNCDEKSIPDSANDFKTCRECLPGQSPDTSHSRCVCADGYYNTSAGRNLIKCYTEGEPFSVLSSPDPADCHPCADTGCKDNAIVCSSGIVTLRKGFALSQTGLAQGLLLNEMVGQRNIYECSIEDSCLGDDPQTPCGVGYAGPLCDFCADGYSRPGFNGVCVECSDGLSAAWVVFAGLMGVAAVTVGLYVVSSVDAEPTKMTTVVTLGKIAVGLVQVLTQLEFCLQLIWPGTFRWFINLLKVFSMDLLGFVDIGCLSTYTYTGKFYFAMLLAPIMLGSVGLVYQLRKTVEGIANRCIKMGLTVVFLIYPFVSQTVFQGFSCRELDEGEEWLDVDFQISCTSDSYLAFVTLGSLGVFLYPLGVPTLTMLLLVKNGGEIKAGGPAFERYNFLVADYRPQFYYWDCLEMLRKATLTGVLMFFSKGSLSQLVLTMVVCVGFLCAATWWQPYASRTANLFKVGSEVSLLVTLMLVVLLKIDLSKEDIPGGENFVGSLLFLTNTGIPGGSILIGLVYYGFEVALDDDLESKVSEIEFDDNPISESPETSDKVQLEDA